MSKNLFAKIMFADYIYFARPHSRPPHGMRSIVDPVRADAVFGVDDREEREDCAQDGGQRGDGGYHEHDDNLEACGLLNG